METGKGRMRKFRSLQEELQALDRHPLALALLEDLEKQSPERVAQLMDELRELADTEEPDYEP